MSDGKNVFGRLKGFPKTARPGEVIGGGFLIFRRGDGTNRVRPSQWPFEYDNADDAMREANKLAEKMPGYTFDVFARHASVVAEKTELAA